MIKKITKADYGNGLLQSLGKLGLVPSSQIQISMEGRLYPVNVGKDKRISGLRQFYNAEQIIEGMEFEVEYDPEQEILFMKKLQDTEKSVSETWDYMDDDDDVPLIEDDDDDLPLIEEDDDDDDWMEVDETELAMERELKARVPVDFVNLPDISCRKEAYRHSGQQQYHLVLPGHGIDKETKVKCDSSTNVVGAWKEDSKFLILCEERNEATLYTVTINGKTAKIFASFDRKVTTQLLSGYYTKDYSLYSIGKDRYLLQSSKGLAEISSKGVEILCLTEVLWRSPICYMDGRKDGSDLFLLFGESLENLTGIVSSKLCGKITDILSEEDWEKINAYMRYTVEWEAPEYLADSFQDYCRISYEPQELKYLIKINHTFRRNNGISFSRYLVAQKVKGKFREQEFWCSRVTGKAGFYGVDLDSCSGIPKPDVKNPPEPVRQLMRSILCAYAEGVRREHSPGLLWKNMEQIKENLLWWSTDFETIAAGKVTVVAVMVPDGLKSDTWRRKYFFRKNQQEWGTGYDLYSGEMLYQLQEDCLQDEVIRHSPGEAAERAMIATKTVLAGWNTASGVQKDPLRTLRQYCGEYIKYQKIQKGPCEEKDYAVSEADFLEKVYYLTDAGQENGSGYLELYMDLSAYGLGAAELVRMEEKNGELIPLLWRADAYDFTAWPRQVFPDTGMLQNWMPAKGVLGQKDVKVYGVKSGKDVNKMTITLRGIDEEGNLQENPMDRVYENLSFWVKQGNFWLEHPILRNVYAYTLRENGIFFVTEKGLFFGKAQTGQVLRVNTSGMNIDFRQVMKIERFQGMIRLHLFEKLGEGWTNSYLMADYFDVTDCVYAIKTRIVDIEV